MSSNAITALLPRMVDVKLFGGKAVETVIEHTHVGTVVAGVLTTLASAKIVHSELQQTSDNKRYKVIAMGGAFVVGGVALTAVGVMNLFGITLSWPAKTVPQDLNETIANKTLVTFTAANPSYFNNETMSAYSEAPKLVFTPQVCSGEAAPAALIEVKSALIFNVTPKPVVAMPEILVKPAESLISNQTILDAAPKPVVDLPTILAKPAESIFNNKTMSALDAAPKIGTCVAEVAAPAVPAPQVELPPVKQETSWFDLGKLKLKFWG
ncbi:MAG: hypothetical protein JSR37_06175 [Verrucomicrobia bacterium]|nr:hypothetical protein [Verrucomicrobiota bacterium]MBS0636592.1 hypothetical protein [Verrucomicrobiota bacterium]